MQVTSGQGAGWFQLSTFNRKAMAYAHYVEMNWNSRADKGKKVKFSLRLTN
jgi:hypothetical protein